LHLDLAGLPVRVRTLAAHDRPGHRHDVLRAEPLAAFEQLGRRAALLGVEGHLRDPVAVAQIDEHDRAVVAAVLDPAVEGDGRPDVRGAQLAAGVRAFPGCHEGSALLYARPRGADTANCAPGRAPDATAAPPRRARAPCTPAVLEHRRRAFDPRPPAKVRKARARV